MCTTPLFLPAMFTLASVLSNTHDPRYFVRLPGWDIGGGKDIRRSDIKTPDAARSAGPANGGKGGGAVAAAAVAVAVAAVAVDDEGVSEDDGAEVDLEDEL
jgi:hypothetical protein